MQVKLIAETNKNVHESKCKKPLSFVNKMMWWSKDPRKLLVLCQKINALNTPHYNNNHKCISNVSNPSTMHVCGRFKTLNITQPNLTMQLHSSLYPSLLLACTNNMHKCTLAHTHMLAPSCTHTHKLYHLFVQLALFLQTCLACAESELGSFCGVLQTESIRS